MSAGTEGSTASVATHSTPPSQTAATAGAVATPWLAKYWMNPISRFAPEPPSRRIARRRSERGW
jgi:hypothetical protein